MKASRIGLIVAGLLVTLGLNTACSADNPTPTVTVTKTVTAPAPTASSGISGADIARLREEEVAAKAYLNSSDRIQMFKHNFEPAALRIAKGLESGGFGPTDKYNNLKLPLKGEVGWGGIASLKGAITSAYAWVWFDATGKIDYGRGIKGASINDGTPNGNVQIETEGVEAPYQILLKQPDGTHVTLVHFSADTSNSGYVYPQSTTELIQLDRMAIGRLNANMAKAFGPNWQN